MPTVTFDLSEDALAILNARARLHDQPLEAEARSVLEDSLGHRRFQPERRVRRGVSPAEPASEAEGGESGLVRKFEIPESYRRDLHRATEILKDVGCTEIYLFGSLVSGPIHQRSDVDLAVRGCPKRRFFPILGRLRRALDHAVDLVDLDSKDLFVRYLETEGELVQIG